MSSTEARIIQDFEISENDSLGQGAFGKVYKAKKIDDDQFYAIKIIRFDSRKSAEEVKVLAELDHPNILRYYNSWIEYAPNVPVFLAEKMWNSEDRSYASEIELLSHQGYIQNDNESKNQGSNNKDVREIHFLCIQTEFCPFTLRDIIKDCIYKKPEELHDYMEQICQGLKHLHEKKYVHRDLKPENIFFSKNGYIKIGDFGLSKKCEEPGNQNMLCVKYDIGTCLYAAPETANIGQSYGSSADIYSLGLIFYEMCTEPMTTDFEKYKVFQYFRTHQKWPEDRKPLEKYEPLLSNLLKKKPNRRLNCEQILSKYYSENLTMAIAKPHQRRKQLMNFIPKLTQIKSDFTDVILQKATEVFELHFGKNIVMPTFLPADSSDNAMNFTNDRRETVSLCYNSRILFAKFAVLSGKTAIRSISTQKVFPKMENLTPVTVQECSFDIFRKSNKKNVNQDLFDEVEVLYTAKEIVDRLPGDNVTYFYLNDQTILDALLDRYFIATGNKKEAYQLLTKASTIEMNTLDFKNELTKLFDLNEQTLSLILKLYEPRSWINYYDLMTELKIRKTLLNKVQKLVDLMLKFGIKSEHIFIAPLLLTPILHYSGMLFKVYIKTESGDRYTVASGGRYDKFIRFNGESNKKNCNYSAVGISLNVENLNFLMKNISKDSVQIQGCLIISKEDLGIELIKILWSKNVKALLTNDFYPSSLDGSTLPKILCLWTTSGIHLLKYGSNGYKSISVLIYPEEMDVKKISNIIINNL